LLDVVRDVCKSAVDLISRTLDDGLTSTGDQSMGPRWLGVFGWLTGLDWEASGQ
jgi:hypothetical protein